jgi:hypothetical protein
MRSTEGWIFLEGSSGDSWDWDCSLSGVRRVSFKELPSLFLFPKHEEREESRAVSFIELWWSPSSKSAILTTMREDTKKLKDLMSRWQRNWLKEWIAWTPLAAPRARKRRSGIERTRGGRKERVCVLISDGDGDEEEDFGKELLGAVIS